MRSIRMRKICHGHLTCRCCAQRHVHAVFIPLKSAGGGGSAGSLGVIQETNPDLSEDLLTAKNAFLHLADVDVFILDAESRIIFSNRTQAEDVGLPFAQVFAPQVGGDDPFYLHVIRDVLAGRAETRDKVLVDPANEETAYRVDVRRIYGRGDRSLGVICVAMNVSKELELKNRLQAAEHLGIIGELASLTAHELRNPLAAMRAGAQLGMLHDDVARKNQAFERLVHEIDRLNNMITELLMLSDSYREGWDWCRLPELFEEVLAMVNAKVVMQHVEIVRQFPPDLPPIQCQRRLLRQALLHPILNALQAMPRGGVLTLRGELRNAHLRISIADTGDAMDPRLLKRLFSPISSAERDRTGLGFAVTHQIVSNHHAGRIWVDSGPKGGTTTYLELPVGSRMHN